MISTVSGEIGAADLGITSVHEHIPLHKAGAYRDDAIAFAIDELKKARDLGLRSIVEVSPERDVEGIKVVAEAAEMQVIVCTGFYTFDGEWKDYTEEQFYRHMMGEITEGIGDTGVKPGVIKIASHNAVPSDVEVRALHAAGRVQAESGLPLCVHSVTGCAEQQKILSEAGADLKKVYFSHVEAVFGWEGRTLAEEIQVLLSIVAEGSTLCFNNFGNTAHTSLEELVAVIKTLVDNSYSNNQVATMDTVWSYPEGLRTILWEDVNPDGKERTYPYLLSHAIPSLKAAGVTDADLQKMIRDTPRRLFEH